MLDIFNAAVTAHAAAYLANPMESFGKGDVVCNLVAGLKTRLNWKMELVLHKDVDSDRYKFKNFDLQICPVLADVAMDKDHPRSRIDICLFDADSATIMPRRKGRISTVGPPAAVAVEVVVSHGGNRLGNLKSDLAKLKRHIESGSAGHGAVVFVDHRCKRFIKKDMPRYRELFSDTGIFFHHVSRFGYERDFEPVKS